jgi:hypothetical protein
MTILRQALEAQRHEVIAVEPHTETELERATRQRDRLAEIINELARLLPIDVFHRTSDARHAARVVNSAWRVKQAVLAK